MERPQKLILAQIKAAHSLVKSGADFPQYVQDIIQLGVQWYEVFVTDGHVEYIGINNYQIQSEHRYPKLTIAANSDAENFKLQLKAHQQGQSDYSTFIKQCALNGIEKWIVDTNSMTCIYYDIHGHEILTEQIPTPAKTK